MKRIFLSVVAALAFTATAAAGGLEDGPRPSGGFSCALGAHGSWVNADASVSGLPITIGSTGYAAGVRGQCEQSFGNLFAGGRVDYSRIFGDLHTLGVDSDIAAAGYFGVRLNSNADLYGFAGKAWTKGGGIDLDAWEFGGGIRSKIGDSQWVAFGEYAKRTYDVGSGPLDLNADIVRVGVLRNFNW